MDEKRIKQAESNFRNYLREGKIKKTVKFDNLIYNTYLKNSRESLTVANRLFQDKTSSLWVVVTSYYSMFYIACAYLYKLGYKPGEEMVHQVVNESLIVHGRNKIKSHILENYKEEKEKALTVVDSYLEDYEREKVKRASFQYETTEEVKENRAQTSLSRAREVLPTDITFWVCCVLNIHTN